MQPHKWAAQKDLCFESWVQCSSINTLISAAGTFVSFAADFTPKLSIFVYYSRPATMRQQLHWVCHNLRINNWNFNRPMTVILSRQLSNSWCSCQQHVKTIWLKFEKLFSTSIQGLLDWVPLSFSVETFSLSVENIFLSPQKKVCSRSWVSWMILIFSWSSWSDVNRVKSEFVVEMKIRSKTGKCSPVSGWSFIERWDSLGAWLLCVRCYICVSGVSSYIMGCNTRDTSILPNTTKNIFLQQPAFNLPVRLGSWDGGPGWWSAVAWLHDDS